MKLTQHAIDAINNKATKTRLALELDFTEVWISRLLDKNTDNGPLTTMAAIKVIRKDTGLSDKQILEEVTEHATA